MVFQFPATVKCYFFLTQVRGKLNNLSLPYNNNNVSLVILQKLYIHRYAFRADPKSFSVICLNRSERSNWKLWDEKPLRSLKIFFLFSFHSALAFSCSDRVVSFEAEKSELEFLKVCSYLKIIDLRLLTKDNSSEGGRDKVDSTRRGLHSIRRLCYSHKLLKL